ncbi:MAG: hypothetical protein ABJH04_08225 [Cyclobacteriaceae bacterium]
MNNTIQKEGTTSKESSIMRFIKSERWALIVFVAITIPLMVHTSHLIIRVSGLEFGLFPGDDIIYSSFFAIGFDMAILTLAVRGRVADFGMITFLIFLFNAFFLNWNFINTLAEPIPTVAMIFIRLVIAGTATWLVHAYVSFYVSQNKDQEKDWALYKQVDELKKQLDVKNKDAQSIEKKYQNDLDASTRKIEELEQQLQGMRIVPLVTDQSINEDLQKCVCGSAVSAGRSLSTHLRFCEKAIELDIKSLEELQSYFATGSAQTNQDHLSASR